MISDGVGVWEVRVDGRGVASAWVPELMLITGPLEHEGDESIDVERLFTPHRIAEALAAVEADFRPGWCSCGHPASGHDNKPPNACQVCSCDGFTYN